MNNPMGLKPGVSFLSGKQGSGKTRTLAWLAEEFASQGLPVYFGSPTDTLGSHPAIQEMREKYPEIQELHTVEEIIAAIRQEPQMSVFLLDDLSTGLIPSGQRHLDTMTALDSLAKETNTILVFTRRTSTFVDNPHIHHFISTVPHYILG